MRSNRVGPRLMMGVAGMCLTMAGLAHANGLQVTNVKLSDHDGSTAYIHFDVTWQNAWRNAKVNHDAAWIFFKVRKKGAADWLHVRLEGAGMNPSNYLAGSGTPVEILVPDDGMGLFVRRSGEGSGALAATGLRAVLNTKATGLDKSANVDIQALGIEMVYVAEGAFWAGNTNGVSGSSFHAKGSDNTPVCIDSTNALTIYFGPGDGDSAVLPAAYPKGYGAFYCMKYELMQGQYVDFLNMLNRRQQTARTATQIADAFALSGRLGVFHRNGVRCPTAIPVAPEPITFGCDADGDKVLNESSDGRDRSCNYLAWGDGCAFADWAGLRPLTELEFEKACRGPLPPVAGEYAWGNAVIRATTSLSNDGTSTETAKDGNCNYDLCSPHGPYRAGIYATAKAPRQAAGASYWGILDLSGNLCERPVTMYHGTSAYTGRHGDGKLTADAGAADVPGWPDSDYAKGAGFRGGGWVFPSSFARVADRSLAMNNGGGRHQGYGWRGVRTAEP